jgi:hypothetical protein
VTRSAVHLLLSRCSDIPKPIEFEDPASLLLAPFGLTLAARRVSCGVAEPLKPATRPTVACAIKAWPCVRLVIDVVLEYPLHFFTRERYCANSVSQYDPLTELSGRWVEEQLLRPPPVGYTKATGSPRQPTKFSSMQEQLGNGYQDIPSWYTADSSSIRYDHSWNGLTGLWVWTK